jgi:hypothetical protein
VSSPPQSILSPRDVNKHVSDMPVLSPGRRNTLAAAAASNSTSAKLLGDGETLATGRRTPLAAAGSSNASAKLLSDGETVSPRGGSVLSPRNRDVSVHVLNGNVLEQPNRFMVSIALGIYHTCACLVRYCVCILVHMHEYYGNRSGSQMLLW